MEVERTRDRETERERERERQRERDRQTQREKERLHIASYPGLPMFFNVCTRKKAWKGLGTRLATHARCM